MRTKEARVREVLQDPTVERTPGIVTIRVWELPVRVLHWTVVGAVLVLAGTGYYIGDPYILVGSEPGFVMGLIRAIHLAAAWVFSVAIICRIIWSFIGNRWSRWDQLVPVHRERRVWLWKTLGYYLFLRKEPPPAAGHNPLAGVTYLVVFVMFVVQIITGLALAALANPQGVLWSTTSWVFGLFAIQTVRLIHHLIMWLTIGFVIHHVYSAVLVDIEEKSGLVSSILTGYKRLPIDRL
ncbi:putative Ni/Fe-hydrogenase 1 B-type cytochrome subunit [bacterium BMS3Abin02]|nr:putative Ni/Fe-hydrogenase 1 B-type cytochrome subunit [bacterium BMS3Abin02]GBE22258.1 putative Ni/Fe-hydrogenase 1 B-type cytochrome subunit [bacterium BMS3Bbin01]